MRTDFFGLTGHQLVGGTYSNKEFTSIDQRVGFPLRNQKLAQEDGSWPVYYNFDQYFCETEKGSGRGAGIGGKGFFSSRPYDQFGIGYYYLDIESPTLQGPLQTRSFLRDEWGFEAFYNVALTPWLLLTPDIQVIGPTQKQRIVGLRSRESVDTAAVLGFRVQLVF